VIECNDAFKGHLSGKYSLKYLNLFTKATGMCSSVNIMQEDENRCVSGSRFHNVKSRGLTAVAHRFLTLKYNVANLGDLRFFLATKATE
jgi:proliferating cell nuclear antigen